MLYALLALCTFMIMSTTTPHGFVEFTANYLRRHSGALFDTTEYKRQNAVVLRRSTPVVEALTNGEYERYCQAAGIDPRDMPRVETPHRDDPSGTIPRLDWDTITDERFALDATYVMNELRQVQSRVSLGGAHVRVIRHGHSAGVLVPPEWATQQRAQLAESENHGEDGEPASVGTGEE